MDPETIRRIVVWIKDHPAHLYDSDVEDCTPGETWFRFCADPVIICEYERSTNHGMTEEPVANGCSLIFSLGSFKGTRCNRPLVPGKDRCAFHNHPVFSTEVRHWISQQLAAIDADFARVRGGTPAPKRVEPAPIIIGDFGGTPAPEGIEPVSPPPKTSLNVVTFAPNLYRAVENNVIVYQITSGHVVCVGYIPDEARAKRQGWADVGVGDIAPLTTDLKVWCQYRNIGYTDAPVA
jgi:hypothetical protein